MCGHLLFPFIELSKVNSFFRENTTLWYTNKRKDDGNGKTSTFK